MQIYKLFGSLQYKVVKISHTLSDFYNSAGFTYINNTKKAASKSQQPKRNGSDAPELFCVKISIQKIPKKNLLPRKLYKKRNFKACED